MFLSLFSNKLSKKEAKQNKEKIEENLSKTARFIILLLFVLNFSFPQFSLANPIKQEEIKKEEKKPIVVILKSNYQTKIKKPFIQEIKIVKKIPEVSYSKYITVTAYSSTVDQCDSTPFITANGTRVYDGIIAANFLRFGTKVRFPEYSGNKIYTVEDRMHQRFSNRADIWMTTRTQAINFGAKRLKMEVLKKN
ncbi:MAG: hypothetical protein U9O55_02285 [Patescibacteria group bacterium]|nr:hypothetical protein [Patescibacteria group bacterium]